MRKVNKWAELSPLTRGTMKNASEIVVWLLILHVPAVITTFIRQRNPALYHTIIICTNKSTTLQTMMLFRSLLFGATPLFASAVDVSNSADGLKASFRDVAGVLFRDLQELANETDDGGIFDSGSASTSDLPDTCIPEAYKDFSDVLDCLSHIKENEKTWADRRSCTVDLINLQFGGVYGESAK
jgi:hypothetical protein